MDNDFKERIKYDVYNANDTEKEMLYRSFVDSQKSHFESYIKFINAELCTLKHFRIVSDFTRFLARIKSEESSIHNDNRDNKALNDVFGLEIDTATTGEYAFLVELFKETLKQTKEKPHNKNNKYVAHHYSGHPKIGDVSVRIEEIFDSKYDSDEEYEKYMNGVPNVEKERLTDDDKKRIKVYYKNYCDSLNDYISITKKNVKGKKLEALKRELKTIQQWYYDVEKIEDTKEYQPIIEGQFKTIQTAIEANLGAANHGDYKRESIAKIQQEYDRDGRFPLSRLPIMYMSSLETDKNGRAIPPRLLSSEETAKVMYPSLILKSRQNTPNK